MENAIWIIGLFIVFLYLLISGIKSSAANRKQKQDRLTKPLTQRLKISRRERNSRPKLVTGKPAGETSQA